MVAATAGPRDYGAFAPLVFELGATGDEVAATILRDAAARVDAMLGRLAALGAARIALMGGLARPEGSDRPPVRTQVNGAAERA